jgi:hypothetical protein
VPLACADLFDNSDFCGLRTKGHRRVGRWAVKHA